MPTASPISRRALLGALALPALAGCAAPLPPLESAGSSADAQALLAASAAAHGLDALRAMHDFSVSYAGAWRPVVGSLQPALVDAGFRAASEERLLLGERLVAQAHAGPKGRKQVVRQASATSTGTVRVWFNGEETADAEQRDAAALVADDYSLFLLGPMLLARDQVGGRALVMAVMGAETVSVFGQELACDVLRVAVRPGAGFSGSDQLALFIDREARLMRRVRFTLDGLESTRGAIAEVDMGEHVRRHGVWFPTRFHERLLRPLPLAVHDWHMTGLDIDRGLVAAELDGPVFGGRAVAPAAPLA